MKTRLTMRSLRVLLIFGTAHGLASFAAGQGPPPLEAPQASTTNASAAPPVASPEPRPVSDRAASGPGTPQSNADPRTPSSPRRTESGPMLAIPGVTVPRSSPRSPSVRPAAPSGASADPYLSLFESMDAPRDEPDPATGPAASRTPGGPSSAASRTPIPLGIEPLEDGPATGSRPETTRPIDRGSSAPRASRSGNGPRAAAPAAPRSARGLLGRWFRPPTPVLSNTPAQTHSQSRSSPRDERERDDKPPLDANDRARRRIEQQARNALGDHVRSLEVRVVGRNVVIVAQPARFWLKRSVRRALEALPVLEGYRARIDVTN